MITNGCSIAIVLAASAAPYAADQHTTAIGVAGPAAHVGTDSGFLTGRFSAMIEDRGTGARARADEMGRRRFGDRRCPGGARCAGECVRAGFASCARFSRAEGEPLNDARRLHSFRPALVAAAPARSRKPLRNGDDFHRFGLAGHRTEHRGRVGSPQLITSPWS